MTLYSGNWQIAGNNVIGPDSVNYIEPQVAGLRLDSIPMRQGLRGMEWRYQTMSSEDFYLLLSLWVLGQDTGVEITYIDPRYGTPTTGTFNMLQPVAGRRRTMLYDSVSIRFLPAYRISRFPFPSVGQGQGSDTFRFSRGQVTLDSIASAEAFGTPAFIHVDGVYLDGIPSEEAFGTPTWVFNQAADLTGIASEEAFGTPLWAYDQASDLTGIASAEAFGTPVFAHIDFVDLTGIASDEAFGTPIIYNRMDFARSSAGASITSSDPVYLTYVPSNAIDNDDSTPWHGAVSGSTNVSGVVDLGAAHTIISFRLLQGTLSGHVRAFTIESSPDNSTWTQRYTTSGFYPSMDTGELLLTSSASARYWQLTLVGPSVNGSFGSGVMSFELYGY
jgi:hypothetical protein